MGEVKSISSTIGGPQLRPPTPISSIHDRSQFDCGNPDLNDWLRMRGLESNGKSARTYVVCAGTRVIAYYCLAAGAVLLNNLPTAKLRRNMPSQVPMVVIGRLAVDKGYQGRGIGPGMLKDGLLRAITASREIGVLAILVHAIDEKTAAFYRQYGFVDSPVETNTLLLPIERAIAALT